MRTPRSSIASDSGPKHAARALVLAALLALAPGRASAQSADNKAIAEAAFELGRKLMDEGKPAEACPKFEESARLDPSVGALLNLALCNEELGRTATAWARYKEAASLARATGQTDRMQVAEEYAGKVAPKLSHLRVTVTEKIAGLVVKRDGEVLGEALLGEPIPVDPGEHAIEASAPGHADYSTTVVVGAKADTQTVTVPALAKNAEPTPEGPTKGPDTASPSGASGLRTAAFVTGGVGLVALGVGAVFGGLAMGDVGDADPLCPAKKCSAAGYDLIQSADDKALVSTIGFAVGGAALGAGVVLFLVSRPPAKTTETPAPRAFIVPTFARGAAGAALLGTF